MMRSRTTVLALATAIGLGAALPICAQKKGGELTVDAAWLAAHLRDPELVILHVGEREKYAEAHIPGARFVSLGDVAADRPGDRTGLALEMPQPADLRSRLEKLGISDGSKIVVYQAQEWHSPSTRVVFTLQYAGLGDRVVLLDGGLHAWQAAGNPVATDTPPVTPGRITRKADPSLIVDHAFVEALQKSQVGSKLIDGRSPDSYTGPAHGHMLAGHLAGAVNIPFNTMVGEDQRLLPRAELERKFREAGVQPGDTVVAYCHIGQQATLVLFAARVLGHPIKLYDGSMDDWSRRKLPTEGGSQ